MFSSIVTEIRLYTDGACRGNPGPGAIGVVVLDQNGHELETCNECIGDTTNNRAEYHALIKGLDLAAKHCRKTIYCFLDSEVVIKQLNGQYRLKKDELRQLFHEVKDKERPFKRVVYTHVSRHNKYVKKADTLANNALNAWTEVYVTPYPSQESQPQLPRQLHIAIAQSDDADADVARLREVFDVLREFPGEDSVHFAIRYSAGVSKIDVPHITTGYCPGLHERLVQLVGEEGLTIRP